MYPPPSHSIRASFYGCWSQSVIMSVWAGYFLCPWMVYIIKKFRGLREFSGMRWLRKREYLSSSPGTHMKKLTMVTTHACCNPNTRKAEMGALLALAHWPTSLVQLSNPKPMRNLSQKPKQTEFEEQYPRLMISGFHMSWSYTFEVQIVENQK